MKSRYSLGITSKISASAPTILKSSQEAAEVTVSQTKLAKFASLYGKMKTQKMLQGLLADAS